MARRDVELQGRIRSACTLAPTDFVDDILFVVPPYAFRGSPQEYHFFREELATRLEVDVDGLLLVGSGRLGFSLNSDHLGQQFRPESDLDIVIVSSDIFDRTWTELLERRTDILLAGDDERRRLKKTKDNFFSGYLRPDHLPLTSALATDWFPKLAARFDSNVANRHEVKGWLFKSRAHARAMYAEHLGRIQDDLRRVVRFKEEE